MSMLLDALRKTEKRQRARSAPDIFTGAESDEQTGENQGGLHGARLWLVVVVAVAALVLAAVVWILRGEESGQSNSNAGAVQQSESSRPAEEQSDGAGKQVAARTDGGGKGKAKPTSPVAQLAETPPQGNAKKKPSPNGALNLPVSEMSQEEIVKARKKARIEARKKARQERRKAARLAARKEAGKPASKSTAAATRKPAPDKPAQDKPAPEKTARNPAAKKPAPGKTVASAGIAQAADEASSRPAAPDPAPDRRDVPEPISYWELPENVRKQLPEMSISVLVYAENPQDRFLLMDGRRLGHHDELQDGLRLREIRRDGAVMTFRKYRFLVKQN